MYVLYVLYVCMCLSVRLSVCPYLSVYGYRLKWHGGGPEPISIMDGGSLISFTVSLIIFVDHGHTDALSTNQ